MRKIYLLVVLLVGFFLLSNISFGQRLGLILYTEPDHCPPCASLEAALDSGPNKDWRNYVTVSRGSPNGKIPYLTDSSDRSVATPNSWQSYLQYINNYITKAKSQRNQPPVQPPVQPPLVEPLPDPVDPTQKYYKDIFTKTLERVIGNESFECPPDVTFEIFKVEIVPDSSYAGGVFIPSIVVKVCYDEYCKLVTIKLPKPPYGSELTNENKKKFSEYMDRAIRNALGTALFETTPPVPESGTLTDEELQRLIDEANNEYVPPPDTPRPLVPVPPFVPRIPEAPAPSVRVPDGTKSLRELFFPQPVPNKEPPPFVPYEEYTQPVPLPLKISEEASRQSEEATRQWNKELERRAERDNANPEASMGFLEKWFRYIFPNIYENSAK